MASKSKKGLAAMLAVCTAITAAGCAETPIITGEEGEQQITRQITQSSAVRVNEPERKDTPVRFSDGWIIKPQYVNFSLEYFLENADIIVDLTIVEWLGESKNEDAPFFETCYSAKINQTFMGEKHDEVVIVQSGNSKATFNDVPLFKNGDRLLMVLNKADYQKEKENGIVYDFEYENGFYCASWLTFIVCENESELYLLQRSSLNFTDRFLGKVKTADEKTCEKIVAEFLESDSVYAELSEKGIVGSIFNYAFNYDDVVRMLTEIAKEEVNENE